MVVFTIRVLSLDVFFNSQGDGGLHKPISSAGYVLSLLEGNGWLHEVVWWYWI